MNDNLNENRINPPKQSGLKVALVICPVWNIKQPPLSLAYLGAALSKHGISVTCFDFSRGFFNNLPEDGKKEFGAQYLSTKWYSNFGDYREYYSIDDFVAKCAKKILEGRPHAVGISVYQSTKTVSIMLAHKIKELCPETLLVFGGPDCNNLSSILNEAKADAVVRGEGEITITEFFDIIDDRQAWETCAGIAFKRDGEIVKTPERELISDLDIIPFPDWSLFDLSLYPPNFQLPMFTSRGCVGNCTFCSEQPYWKKYRWRSADNIVAEMERNVCEFGINRFSILDSLINGNIIEFGKRCDLIIERGLDVHWGGFARINPKMDAGFLRKAKKAGCDYFSFGIESASQKVLDHMQKNISIADAKRVIMDCYEAGIRSDINLLPGYINETDEDFQMTLDFVNECFIYLGNIYIGSGMYIMPGSILSNNRTAYGIAGSEISGWTADNGRNTPEVRQERLRRLNKLIQKRRLLQKHEEFNSTPNTI